MMADVCLNSSRYLQIVYIFFGTVHFLFYIYIYKIQRISQWSEIIYVKLKKKTRELSSKALGLSFYLQKLCKYDINIFIINKANKHLYVG